MQDSNSNIKHLLTEASRYKCRCVLCVDFVCSDCFCKFCSFQKNLL